MSQGDIVLDAAPTITSRDQRKTETDVLGCFRAFLSKQTHERPDASPTEAIRLNKEQHVAWLKNGLVSLSSRSSGLDASRPWFVFWITHALELMGEYDTTHWAPQVASFLSHCQDPTGGFAGGPMQLPHLAPTYAAISAIIIAGDESAYKIVDRPKLYEFIMRMKSPDGGFMMHEEGETDMRGTYCAIAVASMLHMITDEITDGVAEYVRRCQTWEGGIAGEEGLEAHGGYSYCGLAALCIIGQANALDLQKLLNWAVHKQMSLEGGFQGRANKLVDSCYSFWQGAIFPLIHEAFRQQGEEVPLPDDHFWFSPQPLQTYVFLACQHPSGGLRDKPGKSSDFYHTCYSLSGVAASQHGPEACVVGDAVNRLGLLDIYYNVLLEKSERKCRFFEDQPPMEVGGVQVLGREGAGVVATRRRVLGGGAQGVTTSS